MDTSSTQTRRPPPKNTLFCPDCSHAAPVDGDWIVEALSGGESIACPDCDAVVTVRRIASPVAA
ncbi:hypothetical protein [Halobaculum rubrum]|uniref:hypothetical protein n=1 Tax=Halobaculum rubrum TaxID=2872158 RepID=UPI001CA3BB0E|nr:hypothetical protein [Halobaculum rubrum]QZY00907.1 hypothetical protein K6T25_07585 [Halobaculum rubrum]